MTTTIHTQHTASPWLVIDTPRPNAQLRLFCLPYAGGGASIYRRWSSELPTSVEVCAIQLPGREARMNERPFTRIPALVQVLAEVLAPALDRPFAIFGHSMGALIAFEFARHLRSSYGQTPDLLMVSAQRAPHLPDTTSPEYLLPQAEFVDKLQSFNGTPKEVFASPELMELVIPLLRADFTMCGTYLYSSEVAFSCPIRAFGGSDDPEVSEMALRAWAEHTSADFDLTMIPGGHFFVQSHRDLLLRQLAAQLAPFVQA